MYKKLLLTIISLTLISLNTVFSQERIKGTIIDAQGEYLIGANVVNRHSGKFVSGASAGIKGEFKLEMSAGDTLEITYVGFETQKLSFEDMQFDNLIILEEQNQDLMPVVVLAYKNLHHGGCRFICCCLNKEDSKHDTDCNKIDIAIKKRTWNYYPNPTSGIVNIDVNAEMTGSIEVVDGKGSIIRSFPIVEYPMSIDLSSFSDGLYHLVYLNSEGLGEHIGEVVKIR